MHDVLTVLVNPADVNYINRIMEGYEYLGVVTTVDPRQGLLAIRVTPDTRPDVVEILKHLPVRAEIVETV